MYLSFVDNLFEFMKVELLEGGTFWLSESPSVPGSISWGATAPSIATWAISSHICSNLSRFFLEPLNAICYLISLTWFTHVSTQESRASRIQFPNCKYQLRRIQSSSTQKKCSTHMAAHSFLASEPACHLLWRIQQSKGIDYRAFFTWSI